MDVYLAVAPCGCAHGIETENGREAAKTVADWIKHGSTVERVDLEEAKQRWEPNCPHHPRYGRT